MKAWSRIRVAALRALSMWIGEASRRSALKHEWRYGEVRYCGQWIDSDEQA